MYSWVSFATLAPGCDFLSHCHMLYISFQYLLATLMHIPLFYWPHLSLSTLYVFSRLSVNHTTSNVTPPHHLILLLLHTIQLVITLHAFFPVHATLYKNIVFIFGVNLVHVSARASLSPAQFSITFDYEFILYIYMYSSIYTWGWFPGSSLPMHEHGCQAPILEHPNI